MNVKYFYEFRGLDEVLNRVEILTNDSATAESVTPAGGAFVLDYPTQKKLTTVQGSGASLRLVSQSLFQFVNLHTDDMQGYMIKFYRDGALYWVGWLDSELYNEELPRYIPYQVEFSAADFNVLERLKFRDSGDAAYTDIATLLTHVRRCFNKLALPFAKIYIGCSTTCPNISLASHESLLHKLYIQSSNFYDEDNEPMTCREVIENILRPLGLMIVQKDASIYIYDYNTVKAGTAMKCYNFDTMSYVGDTQVNFDFGEVLQKGTASAAGAYGFEEMINNTQITSSLYAENPMFDESIRIESLSERSDAVTETDKYKLELYAADEHIENPNGAMFAVYTNKDSNGTLIGAVLPYHLSGTTALYRIKMKEYMFGTNRSYNLNIKLNAYVNMRDNPFDTENDADYSKAPYKAAKTLWLHCNLYTVDENDNVISSYTNASAFTSQNNVWLSTLQNAGLVLFFANQDIKNSSPILNSWLTNSNVVNVAILDSAFNGDYERVLEKDYGIGLNIPIPKTGAVHGYLVFEFVNRAYLKSTILSDNNTLGIPVKNVLVNDISLSITDADGKQAEAGDYEFKSYVNKKVAADYEDVTLKVISANEEQLPIGKANLLIKENDSYKLQLSFRRAGQTDILERLLMCTIHSNYTAKNESFSVDMNMTDNPALSFIGYAPVLSDKYFVIGCTLNFHDAITTVNVVGFSADTAQLSSIPYD